MECKECQVHTAALQDILLHAGNESDNSGIASVVSLHIDYYGGWPYYEPYNGTCEAAAVDMEHGPDRCTTDRYHLCSQHASPPEPHWFNYVQCMWLNIDTLKCHNNGSCKQRSDFFDALSRVQLQEYIIHFLLFTTGGVVIADVSLYCINAESNVGLTGHIILRFK